MDLLKIIPLAFPLIFIAIWLVATTVIFFASGWSTLQRRFPDTGEPRGLTFNSQSGFMGIGISMRGVLNLSASPSGLRVSIFRVFAPFSRAFLVPWNEISAERVTWMFAPMTRLTLGRGGGGGRMTIEATTWEALAASTPSARALAVSEASRVTPSEVAQSLFLQWAIGVALLTALVFFLTQFGGNQETKLTFPTIIALPALIFGVAQVIRYVVQVSRIDRH